MSSPETLERRSGWRQPAWLDLALATTLTVLGQVELVSAASPGWHGLAQGAALLAQTAPVALRRREPAVAAVTSATALLAEAIFLQPTNTLSALIAGLLLTYSVGARVSGRALVAVTTYGAVALLAHTLAPADAAPEDVAFTALFATVAWMAGRGATRRSLEEQRRREESELVESERQALDAVKAAEQRARIAREMHDVVAHGMSVMVVQAAAAEQLLDVDVSKARDSLETIRAVGQSSIGEMRGLLAVLRQGAEDGSGTDESLPQPGLAQLNALCEDVGSAGLAIDLQIIGNPNALAPGADLCAYRVIQESLTNVMRHSAAPCATVTLDYSEDALCISIRDAGPSLHRGETHRSTAGLGLTGMRERLAIYGGSLEAGAEPDGGFHVVAGLSGVFA